jgi:myo-inositol-1(or 4)-monophosphatase
VTAAGVDLRACLVAADALARAAGAELLSFLGRRQALATASKGVRRELVTAADRAAEHVIVRGLLQRFPGHAILAEEGVLTERGKADRNAEWLWIVDPLDGTTNFVHGLPFFSVAIALAHRGTPVVAAVHAPLLATTYTAVHGGGAFCNKDRLAVSPTDELADALLATGFSYVRDQPGRDDNAARLARVLPHCRDLRRFGSAELDLCLVAAGSLDGYWELDLAPYDVAAGALVVREAGGTVTDLALGDDWLFGGQMLATNGRLHRQLQHLLGAPGPGRQTAGDGTNPDATDVR